MKPNILFFFTDDQRFDTIAALGNKEIITPNIDRLVENGVSFTHAHIPCGTSGAVCMPSRAMLHSGRTLFHLQNEGQEIPESHITLGETLKNAGYRTFGTGKWHNGINAYARSFTDGANIFFGGMNDHWNVPINNFDPTGKYSVPKKKSVNPWFSNQTENIICDHVEPGKHSSELFAEASIDFIKNYNSNDPFFMYISFMAPHDPRTMPEEFLNMYNPDEISLPLNFKEEHPFDYGIRDVRDEVLAPYPRTPEIVKKHISEYYGMITHLDNELGKVLAALESTGKLEDTIIVFAGDNGLALGQHGLMGKQNCYEHSIRVPLVFSGPGIPKNQKTDSYAYLLDIYPTLCDLVDIDAPSSVEGKSLFKTIMNPKIKTRETLYFAYTNMLRSVKNERYKLIEYVYGDTTSTQLFDFIEDPCELNNLYSNEDYKKIVDSLRKELFKYRDEWDDCAHKFGKEFWDKYKI
ncbi:sulfatase-like hydrolase/transferase [Clostridium grantii]|uniref:Arylsulfatase A n=1 Tax=Clostridium grantii DSM 8605 TaxID=1121316 RepID=A0A1M5U3J1_9CLOT|nr:sulfatase-like hydrolase/transferase [Clostridium grantii]SHH57431.1 Arylsulfatase A [Clostridium grantii DSM 8605]